MARGNPVLSPSRPAGYPSSHRLSSFLIHTVITLLLLDLPRAHSQLEKMYVDVTDLQILVDQTYLLKLVQVGEYNTTLQVTSHVQHPDLIQLVPQTVEIPGSDAPNTTATIVHDICALGKSPGHSEVTFNVTPTGFVNLDSVYLRITVMHSHAINVISYIMGWIYFAAWSVSFYPQIYINFKRKSVVGLNFDFLALNLMGFTMYSLFNCGLYFSPEIQAEYFSRHPRGLNPVQLNDVFFSLHAAFATLITITQCFIYERDDQRVSNTGRGILSLFACVVLVTAVLGSVGTILWLDFLYYCSYIKLCITLIKYMPQAYMNYKRKSTVGWSIGNIFLDFVGGFLSVLQMMLNAYNYNDWISIFGDATKFGLGLFSLIFDIFFMLQHYVFYSATINAYPSQAARDDQRVSNTGRGILSLFACVVLVTAVLGSVGTILWLDFLYYCSYIKLCITLIKYMPQAYMNYKRKSTVGWSIGNIFLDFVGGFLSVLQMMLNAYNYNDWISIFGDATKFGLGLFSLIFDIFFMLQHYVFYRDGKAFVKVNSSDEGSDLWQSDDGEEYFMIATNWHADQKKYDLEGKV